MQLVSMDWQTTALAGPGVQSFRRTLADVRDIFADQHAAAALSADRELYSVQVFAPVPETTEGGLFWGNTVLQPGRVGDEFFMTKGHVHRIRNRAEFYLTASGHGALLLMDEAGTTRFEPMSPGSVHYIPGSTAHRVANTGETPLVFAACWPSDAGHDYETIAHTGFSARMLLRNGEPTLVPQGSAVRQPSGAPQPSAEAPQR